MAPTSPDAAPELQVDPFVFPAANADERLSKLWNMNGHMYSSRYTNPEITSLSAIIKLNAETQPELLAYLYPSNDSMKDFYRVSFRELDQLVTNASLWYACVFSDEITKANEDRVQPTVALIGVGITFDYYITILALLRLHVRILLLSNKNSLAVHQHLLSTCDALGYIVDEANADAIGYNEGFGQGPVPLISIDELQKWGAIASHTDIDALGFKVDDEWILPSVIIHSSGTTGMPKPNVHTNRSLALIARHYRLYQDFYIKNFQLCAPLFHIGGLSVVISGLPLGLSTTFPPPSWPPLVSVILTGWETLAAIGCAVDCAQIAPALIEDMYAYIESTSKDFTPLSKLKVLQSGGAPFAPALLAKLVALGINMKTIYGQTEIAGPMRTLPHDRENLHMARLRNLYAGTGWVVMEDLGIGDSSAECVVYRGYPLAAQLWDAPNAPNPYRTKDIFREDPPGSGFWVILGRRDDLVVHSNGEKTMADGVATLLGDNGPAIARAAVFGTNRPCAAAIIEVHWERIGLVNGKKVEEIVWDIVRSCNQQIPSHSRIDRSLVLILRRGEALPVTPKGTVRRKLAWETFGNRVNVLYDNILKGSADATNSSCFAELSHADYLKACVSIACELPSDFDVSEKSFYDIGLDSQRAVQLRAMLVKRFGPFPLVFIFENHTFEKLLAYLVKLKSKDEVVTESTDEEKIDWIRKVIEKYCALIDSWKADQNSSASVHTKSHIPGCVIYLTGANGALGNALLEVFVKNNAVRKVYCAIRGSDMQSKLVKSLESRGYDTDISKSEKICTIPYDMRDGKLGLDNDLYQKLQNEVSTVLHNAWMLDFNRPIDSFEADCLNGTMNLLSFCLSGLKKTFAFTSSISAIMGPALRGHKALETPASKDPRSASGTGYAQSKYIVERITQHYSSTLDMPVRLLRVGQLCGHSTLGTWQETEMWPMMIATGLDYLNAMPLFHVSQTVNWLPIDACAKTVDSIITNNSTERYTVNNLAHPRPITWAALLDLLAEASYKTFARVQMAQWTASLEKLAKDGSRDVPGLKLLAFFQQMETNVDRGEFDVVVESVVGVEPLNIVAVSKWLSKWCEIGFLREDLLVDSK